MGHEDNLAHTLQGHSQGSGPYSPVRAGNLTQRWCGSTCFFEYHSKSPTMGQASSVSGKRQSEEHSYSDITPARKQKRTEQGVRPWRMQGKEGTGGSVRPWCLQKTVGSGGSVVDNHTREDAVYRRDAEGAAMENYVLELGDNATPQFTPLRKRNLPLSVPGKIYTLHCISLHSDLPHSELTLRNIIDVCKHDG